MRECAKRNVMRKRRDRNAFPPVVGKFSTCYYNFTTTAHSTSSSPHKQLTPQKGRNKLSKNTYAECDEAAALSVHVRRGRSTFCSRGGEQKAPPAFHRMYSARDDPCCTVTSKDPSNSNACMCASGCQREHTRAGLLGVNM